MSEVLEIRGVLEILKKRWKVIAFITFIITTLTIVANLYIVTPQYQVSTKIFIGKQDDSKEQNYNNNDIEFYRNLLKTYCTLMTTNKLVENAIEADNLSMSAGEILEGLTVVPRQDTQIIEVSYLGSDKYKAKEVIESVIKEFMKESTSLIPNGTAKIIEDIKLPEYPSSPNKKMNVSIAFLLGIMAGGIAAIILERLNKTFKTKEQLEMNIELPVIGVVPYEGKIK